MPAPKPEPEAHERRRALTLSDVVERLLARSAADHHSVMLTRYARGETGIEIVVRASSDGEINTPREAAAEAVRLYDELRARYPLAGGLTSATPIDDTKRVTEVTPPRGPRGGGSRRG